MGQRAIAKVKAHKGGGADNAAYIGSLRDEPPRGPERQPTGESSAPPAGDERLVEKREGAAGRDGDDDCVWGWNVPWFVADDGYGIWETEEGRALLEGRSLALSAHHMGLGPPPPSAERLSAEEKRENLVAHFSVLADLEERRGGLSHFRIILTVGPEVPAGELKAMANAFLRANFPLNSAFVAIHGDTAHRHAHVYVHSRQLDDKRVDLGRQYFQLDESWMKVCSERLDDPQIYEVHMALKEETLKWKERAAEAREAGEAIPAKPDRWGDHHDTLLTFRPFDDRWCGRLQAQVRVAEAKVTWLEATKAKAEEVTAAREEARRLSGRLETAKERRGRSKSESKRQLPGEVITVAEQRELTAYERDILNAERLREEALKGPVAPASAPAQAVLRFEEQITPPGGQLSFAFGDVSGTGRTTDQAQPPARAVSETPARRREGGDVLPPAAAVVSSSTDAAARSLGRELVAEARLAYVEHCLVMKRPRREKEKLKAELTATREEQARAREEAEQHRARLADDGAAEPPYLLTRDERSRLRLLSRHMPAHLRERVDREVARARLIADGVEVAFTQEDVSVPRVEDSRPAQAELGQHPTSTISLQTCAARDVRDEGPARVGVEPPHASTALPAESRGAAGGKPPPGDEARQSAGEVMPAEAGAAARKMHAAQEILHARGREAVEFYNFLEAQAGSFPMRVRAMESHTTSQARRGALEKGYEAAFGEKPPAGALVSERDRQYVLDHPGRLMGTQAGVREANVSAVRDAGVSPDARDYIPKEKYEQQERERGGRKDGDTRSKDGDTRPRGR